jgi:hypothetical protein
MNKLPDRRRTRSPRGTIAAEPRPRRACGAPARTRAGARSCWFSLRSGRGRRWPASVSP